MFLHCNFFFLIPACNYICNYIYNYTVNISRTPKPTLKPTHTTKPVPNLTHTSHFNTSKSVLQYNMNVTVCL